MHLPRWDGDVLSQAARASEANFVVACLAEIVQTAAAVTAGAAGQETLNDHPFPDRKATHLLAQLSYFTGPLVTWDERVTMEPLWSGAPVQVHVAATDAHGA